MKRIYDGVHKTDRLRVCFDTLRKIVHDERFAAVPKILETPWLCAEGSKEKTIPPYKEEIAKLRED